VQVMRILHGTPRSIEDISRMIGLEYERTRVIVNYLLENNLVQLYTRDGTKPLRIYIPLYQGAKNE
jgi:hypothetical protein